MFDISAFAQGFGIGLGMFVCPGPKDVLILRAALTGHSALGLVLIGSLSDALLIWIGIGGVSAVLGSSVTLQAIALWLGVALLVIHGVSAAIRAVSGVSTSTASAIDSISTVRAASLVGLIGTSLFNPVAWIDTLLIVGSIGAALPQASQVTFGAGAVCASVTWFSCLVLTASSCRRWMTGPHSWRLLEGFVAIAMFAIAMYVALGVV